MVFNINWMLAILLCLFFSPLYIEDISKFSILIKFFTPYTSNFIFSWCVCIMFIEKSWAIRWKFEQLPPTNLQMESAPLYCSPTNASKKCSFYLLSIPNPPLPITVLTLISILQHWEAHSICYFLFFLHITSSFSALKLKGTYVLIISVFCLHSPPLHAQEQNSFCFISNISSPSNTEWMSS